MQWFEGNKKLLPVDVSSHDRSSLGLEDLEISDDILMHERLIINDCTTCFNKLQVFISEQHPVKSENHRLMPH